MAGEFNAGSVVAKLKLVDDGFGSKLSQAFASTSKFEKGLMAAGAAAVAVGTTIAVLTQQSADYTDKLGKLAQQIGMTTEQLSSYSLAASLSDISTEEFGKSVSLLSRKMVDAASGNEEASKSFAQLGISVKNANGTLKSSDQVLEEIADQFANTKDSATKTALAMDLMGRSGASMIPLLNGGSKEIKNIREEAMKMGLVFSQDAFKAAEQFNDSQTRIGQSLIGLRQQIGQTIISLVNQTGVFDLVAKAVQAVTGWWMNLSASTKDTIVTMVAVTTGASAVAAGMVALSVIIPIVGKALMAAFITNPVGLAITAISLAVGLLIVKWQALVTWLDPVVQAFKSIYKSMMDLKTAIQPILDAFGSFKGLFDGETFENIDFLATGLKAGLLPAAMGANALAAAMGAVIDTIEGATKGFKALFEMVDRIGITMAQLKYYVVDMKMDMGEALRTAFIAPDEGGVSNLEHINAAWAKMGDVAGDTASRIEKRFSDMAERNKKLVEGIWTKNTPPGKDQAGGPDTRGELRGPAASGESAHGGGGGEGESDKKEGPSVLDEIDKWNAKVTSFASKITQDLGQIAQNNLTKISNFASTWVDVFSKHLDKAHQAEMEQLQQVENDKLDILRAALDARLALINEEFNARKRALEAELAAEKRAIDAMTQARILEAQMKSVDKEEEIAAVRTIEEDGERQKEDAEREHQERLDAERGMFNERAQIQTKENNIALEQEKKASDQRLVKLEEKQNAEKKDLAKKSAAVQYALSLAGFFVSQRTARVMAQIEYASALMSATTGAIRTYSQTGNAFAAIASGAAMTAMATLAFASTNAVIASTPPPMPPAELFAEQGGLVPGPRHSQGGVRAELEGGEYIMPRGPAMANLGMLDAMREGRENAGGGVTVIMHVGSMDPGGRSVEAIGRELGLSVRAHL